MRTEEFRKVIQERIACHSEWTNGIEQCWKKEIEILSEDVPSTIDYLINECTPDEYSWISEIIDDLATKTQSKELIECYKSLMTKFPEECSLYSIKESIEYAEAELSGEPEDGET